MYDLTFREAVATLAGTIVVLYLLWWGLDGAWDWGQNEGRECEIGYNPATGICSDPYDSPCSAWSPPFFCWKKPVRIRAQ